MSPTMPASSRLLNARRSADASIWSSGAPSASGRPAHTRCPRRTARRAAARDRRRRAPCAPAPHRRAATGGSSDGRSGRTRDAAALRTRPVAPIASAKRHQRPFGARSRHVVAGDDRGGFRFQKQRGERVHASGIGRVDRHSLSGADGLDRGLLLQHVDRQRDEHRALRRVGRDLEGAAQDRRDLVGALDLHAPLGHGRCHRDEIMAEHRIREPHPRVLLARGHDHRRIGLERAVERADAVAEPGGDMEVGDGGAADGLRIETRGAHRDALMQRHDVFDLRKCRQAVEQRRFRRSGIAEDMTHAVRHEGFHQHTTPAHFSPSRLVLIRFVHHRPGRRRWQPRKMGCACVAGCVFRMALGGAASRDFRCKSRLTAKSRSPSRTLLPVWSARRRTPPNVPRFVAGMQTGFPAKPTCRECPRAG